MLHKGSPMEKTQHQSSVKQNEKQFNIAFSLHNSTKQSHTFTRR